MEREDKRILEELLWGMQLSMTKYANRLLDYERVDLSDDVSKIGERLFTLYVQFEEAQLDYEIVDDVKSAFSEFCRRIKQYC